MLDLVFMGTAAFAVPCLRALAAAGHRIQAVVTRPDRPHGRGMKAQPSPVKQESLVLGLPVLQPEKASQPGFVEQLRALAPQAMVVVAYGQLLRPLLLEIPPLGCVNVHASLLPELRGAAPIQWALIRGYWETGVTTMYLDAGMDTGDLILQIRAPILPEDTAASLAERLAPAGARLLVETMSLIEAGSAPRWPQDPARATSAPPLQKEDGAIGWDCPAGEIMNRIQGCNPTPGAYACRGGVPVKIWRAGVVEGAPGAPPGTVIDARRLVIACREGALRLREVQPRNRARLEGAAYSRGYRVAEGEIWQDGLTLPV